MAASDPGETPSAPPSRVSTYGWYALFVLVLVYIINFVDRQIISILAQDIKHDLHLEDAQIGFLYGTAFAVFYALFGIPLGRLADSWYRGRLIAIGLTLWSSMTVLSGFASNFAMLATARIGVGIGEASASPAAYSMISDYFPKEKRATALSIYSAGLYIGGGLSLPIGGLVSSRWNAAFPSPTEAPLGLVGWQAAFLAVGVPGLLLALWVLSLREPRRGASDGLPQPVVRPNAWRGFGAELVAILPPLTFFSVSRFPGALLTNLVALAG
ncbi:MAG TPA: MFS transporter, partial [Allosphingosinicella sp.]|nr:MFS transporter [Allosphingosinicella sp.]